MKADLRLAIGALGENIFEWYGGVGSLAVFWLQARRRRRAAEAAHLFGESWASRLVSST